MYESSDLRKGLKIEIDGDPYVIVQFEFVKPGKGQALYKCRLKNMISGSQFDKAVTPLFEEADKGCEADRDQRNANGFSCRHGQAVDQQRHSEDCAATTR